jgi:alpha-methylacyl-CoA racemase
MNLVADYGGGTMFLIFGILAAVIERGVSGKGQVVDAAMVDGVPAMMGLIHGMLAQGTWGEARSNNWLDGAAPFYRCYTCSCGGFIAVGALEPQFYALLLEKLGLPESYRASQNDKVTWPARRAEFERVFARQTRDAWAAHFDGSDACVAPVLSFSEAALHPHMAERENLVTLGNVTQSAPAPRFSRSGARKVSGPGGIGADTDAILSDLGNAADP